MVLHTHVNLMNFTKIGEYKNNTKGIALFFHLTGRVANRRIILTVRNGL